VWLVGNQVAGVKTVSASHQHASRFVAADIACSSETSLPRFLCALREPSLNHLSLKSPLVTDFECWKPLLSQQAIDGVFVHVEVFGDLLKRQQGFSGTIFFLYQGRTSNDGWKARAISMPSEKNYRISGKVDKIVRNQDGSQSDLAIVTMTREIVTRSALV
jgi:hypothetical protein